MDIVLTSIQVLILSIGLPFTVLGILYLLAKKYPRISQALHKPDCKCKVCNPLQSLDKGNGK